MNNKIRMHYCRFYGRQGFHSCVCALDKMSTFHAANSWYEIVISLVLDPATNRVANHVTSDDRVHGISGNKLLDSGNIFLDIFVNTCQNWVKGQEWIRAIFGLISEIIYSKHIYQADTGAFKLYIYSKKKEVCYHGNKHF